MSDGDFKEDGYDSDEYVITDTHPKARASEATVASSAPADGDDLFATEEAASGVSIMAVLPAEGALLSTTPAGVKGEPAAPSQQLSIEWVHGYRGFDSRSNVCINARGEIVYPVAGVVVVYDPNSETQRHYLGQDDDILCLTQHPTNLNLVATGQNATISSVDKKGRPPFVCVWDTTDFSKTWVLKFEQSDRAIRSVAFSVDGKYLVTVSNDDSHTIKVWDWEQRTMVASAKGGMADIFFAKWNHKRPEQFFTVGKRHLSVWTFNGQRLSGASVSLSADLSAQTFYSLAFSEKGFACVGDLAGNISVFDSGSLLKTFPGMHQTKTLTLDWWPQGIISGGGDGRVRVLNSKLQPVKEFQFRNKIAAVYATLDGAMIVGTTACELFYCKDFNNAPDHSGDHDADRSKAWRRVTTGHCDGELWALSVNPANGSIYATAGEDNTVNVWDIQHKRLLARTIINAQGGKMPKVRKAASDSSFPPNQCARSISWSPDGQLLAIGCNSGEVRVYQYDSRQPQLTEVGSVDLNKYGKPNVTNVSQLWIQAMHFSPSGQTLAVGTHGSVIVLLSAASNFSKVGGVLKAHNSALYALDWSEDGTSIRANDAAHELLFHRVNESELSASKHEPKSGSFVNTDWATHTTPLTWCTRGLFHDVDYTLINCADINRSKTLVASGDDYGNVNLFRYPALKGHRFLAYEGHSSHVPAVRFTADETRLLSTGGHDKAIIQWLIN